MPLTAIQKRVCAVLAKLRSESAYVGGGAALNRNWPRLSEDLDVFLERRSKLIPTVESEIDALMLASYEIERTVTQEGYTAEIVVTDGSSQTRIQWFLDADSTKRFFPIQPDRELGHRLHDADNAVNKVLCASQRTNAPRDLVDLYSIAENYCELGPLVWAVVAKDSSKNPQIVLREIKRNLYGYTADEIATVATDGDPYEWSTLRNSLDQHIQRASEFIAAAPLEQLGKLAVFESTIPASLNQLDLATWKQIVDFDDLHQSAP